MQGLIDSIKENEGYRAKVYKCSEGFDTIGYGFAIKDLDLPEDICDEILRRNLNKLIDSIDKRFEWFQDMPESVQHIVIEMCYQLGVTGVSKFKKTIAYLVEKDWNKASVEMLDSKWAKQTPNRAKRMSEIVKGTK
tara:strand:+ start:25499 stop:25906 length:408 start_codon:yes stop_codon:yes gene_type:complete